MNNQISRRDFLKLSGIAGGGLVLAIYLEGCASGTPTPTIVPVTPEWTATPIPPFDWEPNIYIKLDQDGVLTFTAFRSEMGQGIRTALAMLAADELDVDWANVRIEQAPADSSYGDQITGGSVSISTYYNPVRMAGATARQMLVNAATAARQVDAVQLKTEKGAVILPDGGRLMYGELVEAAAKLDKPHGVKVKEKAQFSLIGTSLGHWDAPHIVTGRAVYGLDVRLPGMLFAAIARSPVFGGQFESYDDSAAKAVPGVRQVVELKVYLDKRIAVVAENSWAAIQGRNALKVTWNEGKFGTLSSDEFVTSAIERLTGPSKPDPNFLEAVYITPYEAHATMEPMNATAYFHDGVCEVWAPTQSPQDVQNGVANAISLPKDKVMVNVPLIGGGFGRRLQADYAIEAAQVSKAVNAPVQVLWTRDDDLQHDFYQPMSIQYFKFPLDKLSIPTATRTASGYNVPIGPWRSVDEFANAYGVQSFIDEMAVALKRDPLDLRLELYANQKRALDVIKLVAEKSGWGQSLPAGKGRGLAYHATFGVTHVAYAAEVSVDTTGKITVHKVTGAVDCGQVVNSDNVAAQLESGIVFGLTAALKAQATLKDGRIEQSNFHDYPVLRMDEMPVVEIHIIESEGAPSGIGEMGVPPIAPAIANAVYAATGKRIRHIPIKPEDLKA